MGKSTAAMYAYVFWHAAPANIAIAEYENTLLHFGRALASLKIPGLLNNASYSIGAIPWLGEPGYEDWAWLQSLSVLEPLNERAVVGPMEKPHRAIAQLTRHGGFGALFSLVAGRHEVLGDSKVIWVSRPRGLQWRDAMPAIIQSASAEVAVWRRLMVLGPSPEFAIIGPPALTLALPPDWSSFEIERRRLRLDEDSPRESTTR